MQANQKSYTNNIENFLCPFTDMYITQGANGSFSHKGTMANDVRGIKAGVRYPYYAPCDIECIWIYPKSGQSCWRSINKVRFANNNINYATFMIAHDDLFNHFIGKKLNQGELLGFHGMNGNATGIHTHIEISQNHFNMSNWSKNKYGNYCFDKESDTDECYFVDNTNILNGMNGNWKKTSDIVNVIKYINIPKTIVKRNIYDINTKKQIGQLSPKKFGGLSYKILNNSNGYVQINTLNFGVCLVKMTDTLKITDRPLYNSGNF